MTKRTPKRADATIEVTEAEVTPASPPPLPARQERVETHSILGRRFASAALPIVRAAIRRLQALEQRLVAAEAHESRSNGSMATGRA